ncbi:MAG: hypothetical protein ACTHW2_09135 [Tissierella sp.]|uniref:hypothetical protein n=1 Tax=Tissierella sp. TaxID=41274 RepID=UPI003F978AB7
MEDTMKKQYKIGDYLKFIIPSLIGILLLMFPFQYDGDTTIVVALLAGKMTSAMKDILPTIVLGFVTFTGLMTVIYKKTKLDIIENMDRLHLIIQ